VQICNLFTIVIPAEANALPNVLSVLPAAKKLLVFCSLTEKYLFLVGRNS
jgi:hypothetical protein